MASTVSFGYSQRSRSQHAAGRGPHLRFANWSGSRLLRAKPLLWCVLVLIVGTWFAVRDFSRPADAADLLLLAVVAVQLCLLRSGDRK